MTSFSLGRTFLALACAPLVLACSESAAADERVAPVEEEHDGFWWTYLGEQSVAVVNFGPSFETSDGLFRQWSLVIHLPGTPEPLSCTQGLIGFEEDGSIAVRGGLFSLELRPREHHRWGDVRSSEELVAVVEGLY